MGDNEQVRKAIAQSYAEAVEREGGCRGGADAPVQKGVAAKLGGYAPEELSALPLDAVVNSFGCGNPVAFGEIVEGQVVLDLGSGAGIDLLLAAKKVGPTGRVIGVDMTDQMVARARKNLAEAGAANVEVRKGIIEELPVASDSVDWVISNCVINLSPEKDRVFREIARVLKPGGRMLVSDIVAEELPPAVRDDPTLRACCIAGAIPEQKYLEGLRWAGLEEVRVLERLVYDREQLVAFVGSDLPGEGGCCGCADGGGADLRVAVEGVQGRVWSARIGARKPV